MTIDVIRKLCKDRGISIASLEKSLGYGNGSLAKSGTIKSERLKEIAEFFGVTTDYLVGAKMSEGYYLNSETAEVAQEIVESKELSMLFSAARDAKPEDLMTTYQMLLALKRKEKNED